MLSTFTRVVAKSRLHQVSQRSFLGMGGIFKSLRKIFDHSTGPGPANYNMHDGEATSTELFDEDAHEMQAFVTNNAFDVEIHGGDNNTMKNFGTVDNPVVIFSANIGWRYVMCSGQNDEEEGASHTPVWFILRDGPLHRCSNCGQVFKLVTLRDEISEENDYWSQHYLPIQDEEMGEEDELFQRWTQHKFLSPYPLSTPKQWSNVFHVLVNADDHDRILTDPAYRLQKLAEGHQRMEHYYQALIDVESQQARSLSVAEKTNITPEDYRDLVNSELVTRKLDRIMQRVSDFNQRAMINPQEHERREKRMQQRADERKAKGYLQFFNTNETELRFKDYYETDYGEEVLQLEEEMDYQELVSQGIFHFKNYNFIQEGLVQPNPATMNTFERKAFRFEFRKWNNNPATHFIREQRMIKRYFERLNKDKPELQFNSQDIQNVLQNEGENQAVKHAKTYREWVVNEAIQQYKDYYESDPEDLADFEYISPEEKLEFARVFKDYSKPFGSEKYYLAVPRAEWDNEKSFLENTKNTVVDFARRVLPETKKNVLQGVAKEQSLPDSNLAKFPELGKGQKAEKLEDIFKLGKDDKIGN